jgi:hypothetical protein
MQDRKKSTNREKEASPAESTPSETHLPIVIERFLLAASKRRIIHD